MRRREFLPFAGVAVISPLASAAQQPKVQTIGALVIGNTDPEEFWRVFRQGLRDLGYVEGQNIRFEFRSAEGQAKNWPPSWSVSKSIVASGEPRDRSGQCDRSLLQTFPRTGSPWRRSPRSYHQPRH